MDFLGGAPFSMCGEGEWMDHPHGALFRAASKGNVSELRRLLSNRDSPFYGEANVRDGDGGTLLQIAACGGKEFRDLKHAQEFVGVLVEAGADLDAPGFLGIATETALCVAIVRGHYHLVRALVEHGACIYEPHVPRSDTIMQKAIKRLKKHRFCDENLKRQIIEYLEAEYERQRETAGGDTREAKLNELADKARQKGNELYMKKQYKKAIEAYEQSNSFYEDHRTYGNIAASKIKLGRKIYYGGEYGYRNIWKQGVAAAERAIELDPYFPKHYLRKAKAIMNYRDFPRAKMWLKEGIEECAKKDMTKENNTEVKALADLVSDLSNIGVPDHARNYLSPTFQEIKRKLDNGFVGEHRCEWCTLLVLPEPGCSSCPFCASDPRIPVNEDILEDLMLF